MTPIPSPEQLEAEVNSTLVNDVDSTISFVLMAVHEPLKGGEKYPITIPEPKATQRVRNTAANRMIEAGWDISTGGDPRNESYWRLGVKK